jgi:hypothetical protein
VPVPAGHRHVRGRPGSGLGVLNRQPGAPLDVGGERGAEFCVVRQPGVVRRPEQESNPAAPLPFGQPLPEVLGDHPRVPAVLLAVRLRAAEHLAEPFGHPLGVVGRHGGEQRREQGVLGHVLLVEHARHPGQGRQPAGPFEDGRLASGVRHRIPETHVPVHTAAERLVLRVPAAAQGVVLAGGPGVAGRLVAVGAVRAVIAPRAAGAGQGDAAGDPVRAVPGHLDRRVALAVVVDVGPSLLLVDGIAQGTRGAVTDGPDDLVHPAAAGGHERLRAGPEHGREPVGAQPRMLAGAAVVEDGHLLAGVAVALVRHPARILGPGEADPGVRTVAERLDLRAAAPAQGHLRPGRQPLAEPVAELARVGHQVRAVLGDLDLRIEPGLQLRQCGEPIRRGAGLGQADGQVLQGGRPAIQ